MIHIQLSDRTEQVSPHVWRCDIHDANGIDTCLQAYDRIDFRYFLAAEASDISVVADSFRVSLQTHEIQLLRLVQCLETPQHGRRPGGLLHPHARQLPAGRFRQIPPVAGSPAWPTPLPRLITASRYAISTYRTRTSTRHTRWMASSEPATDRGDVVKLYAGRRYKQVLLKLDWCRPGEGTGFREGGVYVIVRQRRSAPSLTRYLIRTYRAKVIWIGRRPEPTPCFRRTSMRVVRWVSRPPTSRPMSPTREPLQSYARIKKDYPAVHGAIFSGLVFVPRTASTTPVNASSATSSRSKPSAASTSTMPSAANPWTSCVSSLRARPFSFSGAANLSAYAAGITFSDAFVRSLRDQAPFPWAPSTGVSGNPRSTPPGTTSPWHEHRLSGRRGGDGVY